MFPFLRDLDLTIEERARIQPHLQRRHRAIKRPLNRGRARVRGSVSSTSRRNYPLPSASS
jgi:hypothetical protein